MIIGNDSAPCECRRLAHVDHGPAVDDPGDVGGGVAARGRAGHVHPVAAAGLLITLDGDQFRSN